jgi:hypothetical protein
VRPAEVQRLINVTDAEHECAHGALPYDRRKPAGCACWDNGAGGALEQRVQESWDFSMDD